MKGGGVGRVVEPIDESLASGISEVAKSYPWWGYRRIAVVRRRSGLAVSDRLVCRVMKRGGLLQKRRVRKAEVYRTAKLVELLPGSCNELW